MQIPIGGIGRDKADDSLFYDYALKITFVELNPEGTVSHDKYATLFGKARELFALECFPVIIEQAGRDYFLHTRDAHYKYMKNFLFGDILLVRMRVSKVRKQIFQLKADFIHVTTDEIRAKGTQTIVCTDLEGNLIDIPDGLRKALFDTLPKTQRSTIPV